MQSLCSQNIKVLVRAGLDPLKDDQLPAFLKQHVVSLLHLHRRGGQTVQTVAK